MAGLYLVGAWLVVEVASTVLPMFGAQDWVARSIMIALAVGFLRAMIFSWVFELTPDGVKRDADVLPQESIAPQTARSMDRILQRYGRISALRLRFADIETDFANLQKYSPQLI